MTRVTYVPIENGDPLHTSFGGFDFHNGEPVEIPDDATVLQTIIAETSKTPDGEARFKGVERKVPVIEVLKGNPYFRIDGAEPPKRAGPGRPRMPKTPEEYRNHVMGWLRTIEDHREFKEKWRAEAGLREKLSVFDDGDDVRYLKQFLDARLFELERAAGIKRTVAPWAGGEAS